VVNLLNQVLLIVVHFVPGVGSLVGGLSEMVGRGQEKLMLVEQEILVMTVVPEVLEVALVPLVIQSLDN
jgi:hypothetical protein